MLTQEGKEAARECISRSGLPDPSKDTSTSEGLCDPGTHNMQDIELVQSDSESDVEVMASPVNLRRQKPMDISPDYLERVYLHLASKFVSNFLSRKFDN